MNYAANAEVKFPFTKARGRYTQSAKRCSARMSLSGKLSIAEAAKWLAERAKQQAAIIIKRGANGASAWQAGMMTDVPAPKVKVVDTTGAGDAFNAGYLAACLRGADIARALQEGIEIASAAIASSPRHYRRPEFSLEELD